MKISCIMPTANRPVEIMRATQQFLEQDYPEKELVVVYKHPRNLPAGWAEFGPGVSEGV